MRNSNVSLPITMLAAVCLSLTGCSQSEVNGNGSQGKPAKIERVEGTGVSRVVLTSEAAKRLDIQTAAVRAEQTRKVIPYAAILYDSKGDAWTFTNPAPLTYLRQRITVDHIAGENVVLVDGPAAGTTVVTVGVAELYGAELGVGK